MKTSKKYWNTGCPTLFIYTEDDKYVARIHLDLDGVEEEDDTRDELADKINECTTIEEAQEVCEDMFYHLNLI